MSNVPETENCVEANCVLLKTVTFGTIAEHELVTLTMVGRDGSKQTYALSLKGAVGLHSEFGLAVGKALFAHNSGGFKGLDKMVVLALDRGAAGSLQEEEPNRHE